MDPRVADTIVALSSTLPAASRPGEAYRAIVRLSGPRALELAATVLETPGDGTGLCTLPGRGWRRLSGNLRLRPGRMPASAWVMPGPHSYTRQDVVELHVPALPVLVSELLDALLAAGARAAQPGEFTRRALLNGRLTLAQAEAVGALIAAGDADSARALAARSAGQERSERQALREDLEALLGLLELGLDFSQEDAHFMDRPELLARARALAVRARQAAELEAGEPAAAAQRAPRAVLVGPANAGKSSLFNALLGRDRALVDAAAHTTRDPVEAPFFGADGSTLTLVDTAGLGAAHGGASLVALAQDATARAARAADLLLWVLPADAPEALEACSALEELGLHTRPAASRILWSKADLAPRPESAAARELENRLKTSVDDRFAPALAVSAHSGIRLEELRAWLSEQQRALNGRVAAARQAGAAAARRALQAAAEALERAAEALAAGLGEDAAAVELREAVHALVEADGVFLRHDALTESLLDRIFTQFCIGK
ncbi:MAG: 50S ribosome-binding GTPase [Planctomycetes bacterium]|nr:50S ribosome-binding GTPase [Planctomycetota bacterium]